MAMNNKKSVFVLMPFDEDFDSVYEHLLKPVLEDAGLDVLRADDIQSQQSILKDIIKNINESDLILADLTDANPNVFYELGIAHAFGKPVVLVTQSIEDVPFDLKPYRLVEYSTHFVKIKTAEEKLSSYGKGFIEGKIPFGSPVTDCYPEGIRQSQVTGTVPHNTTEGGGGSPVTDCYPEGGRREEEADNALNHPTEEDERGFLDHLIDINEGYISIATIIGEITSELQDVTVSTETAAKDFNEIGANPNASSPAAAQRVSRRLAERIGTFNGKLAQANTEYTSIARGIEDSLEFVVSFHQQHSEETVPEVEEQISSLRSLRDSAIEGRDSFNTLADTMDALPRIERRLNREVARGSEGIRIMAGNVDKTIASISRALNYHG